MMSALPRMGLSSDLFNKGDSAVDSFQYTKKESRSSYDIGGKKKRRAPAPPSGLSQYKPKILSSESSVNVPVARGDDDSPVPPPRSSRSRGPGNATSGGSDTGVAKPILMGDKDVPMVLPSQHDSQDVDLNVSSLNLTSHDLLNDHQDTGTDNPLFSIHDENNTASQTRDNPLFNMHDENSTASQPRDNPLFDMHDENNAASQPVGNPLFNMYDENNTASQPRDNPLFNMHEENNTALQPTDNPVSNMNDKRSSTQHRLDSDPEDTDKKKDDTEPEGVYIPAPDYEEEELTMAIAEELEEDYPKKPPRRRRTRIYKEYDGEDFGQYLSDEENGYEEILRRVSRPNVQRDIKSKTEVKRPHNKKRQSIPLHGKKDKGVTGYTSLRTFSYADSKFGTVNKKKPLSSPEDTKEAEAFTGASYEHFLYSQNGEDWDQPGRQYGYMQEASSSTYPEQARSKDSVWKKLTWKVKKQMNSFDLTASS